MGLFLSVAFVGVMSVCVSAHCFKALEILTLVATFYLAFYSLFLSRIDYLSRYLSQLRRAMDWGVDIKGYFVWSLLDNFE